MLARRHALSRIRLGGTLVIWEELHNTPAIMSGSYTWIDLCLALFVITVFMDSLWQCLSNVNLRDPSKEP